MVVSERGTSGDGVPWSIKWYRLAPRSIAEGQKALSTIIGERLSSVAMKSRCVMRGNAMFGYDPRGIGGYLLGAQGALSTFFKGHFIDGYSGEPRGIDGHPAAITAARDDPENGILMDHANQPG